MSRLDLIGVLRTAGFPTCTPAGVPFSYLAWSTSQNFTLISWVLEDCPYLHGLFWPNLSLRKKLTHRTPIGRLSGCLAVQAEGNMADEPEAAVSNCREPCRGDVSPAKASLRKELLRRSLESIDLSSPGAFPGVGELSKS